MFGARFSEHRVASAVALRPRLKPDTLLFVQAVPASSQAFGKYLLVKQIGKGGMAEVFLARQRGPQGFEKECVIKRILPKLAADEQFVRMFLDEARIAAPLSHPNIVQIFDLGEAAPREFFIAMEYVNGVDLQQIVDAEATLGQRMPLPIAIRIVSNVAEGLGHAHRATDSNGQPLGLVHRDISPSNILVSFDGIAKLCDFGIAKAMAGQRATQTGTIKGKVPYMSPEQLQAHPLDARSDLFSLGVVLYELTCGTMPFAGKSPVERAVQTLQNEPCPPSLLVDDYPPSLAVVTTRALAKRPEDRFQTAREFQRALEEVLLDLRLSLVAHDVSSYLEELFPLRVERSQAVPIAHKPHQATEKGVAMPKPSKPTQDTEQDIASASSQVSLGSAELGEYGDNRHSFGEGRSNVKFVIPVLVALIAAGFWWLTTHMGQPAAAPATENVNGATPATTPVANSAAPAPAANAVSPTPTPTPTVVPPVAPPVVAAPPFATAPATPAEAPTVAPKPVAATKPPVTKVPIRRVVRRREPAGDLKSLPHLPLPPPPDDKN